MCVYKFLNDIRFLTLTLAFANITSGLGTGIRKDTTPVPSTMALNPVDVATLVVNSALGQRIRAFYTDLLLATVLRKM